MLLNLKLQDDQYPKTKITHVREVARAILLNEKNEIALIHINRDDIFGNCEYFETPGGGIDEGETPEEAVVREVHEEIGCICEVISKLGVVDDFYNLINRENISHYYLCQFVKEAHTHRLDYEKAWFEDVVWVPLKEAIRLYEKEENTKLSILVKRRELPILYEALKILEK
ncbi:MAG: NUDIX hydrolase [Bacilli bacterium]|nr:NUDIX hydrolase [Bacilli bacterium]